MSISTDEGVLSSWTWFFDTEDEAHMFALGYKDELAEEESFEYVDHDVDYDLKAGSWKLSLRYIDSRPAGPEAA
jgi:hypothetical protein